MTCADREQSEKEKLQTHLDDLARTGRQAAARADAPDVRPALVTAVEEAVHLALLRDEHSLFSGSVLAEREAEAQGSGSASRLRLVNSLAKTEVMARRLKAMAAEVEQLVGPHNSGEQWLSPQPVSSSRRGGAGLPLQDSSNY